MQEIAQQKSYSLGWTAYFSNSFRELTVEALSLWAPAHRGSRLVVACGSVAQLVPRAGRKGGPTWDFLSRCESLILSTFLVLHCLLSGKQECGHRSQTRTGTIALVRITTLTDKQAWSTPLQGMLPSQWTSEMERKTLHYPCEKVMQLIRTSLGIT